MALPKTPVTVRFGKLDQYRAPRHTMIGALSEAVNVRQRKLGRYEKRYGLSVMDKTTDTGTISAGQGIASTPDALILHANDTMWVRDATASLWRNRGAQARAFPTDIGGVDKSCIQPFVVISGTQTWTFAHFTSYYTYRVHDTATGVELKAETTVTATIDRIRAIAAGGFVWLFRSTGTVFNLDKYNPASVGTAATTTAFFTKTAGASTAFIFDVVTTTSGVAVIAKWDASTTVSTVNDFAHSAILDTATGLPAASPGVVGQGISATTASGANVGAIAWISYDGTSGTIYFASTSDSGGAGSFILYSIATATHAGLAAVWSTVSPAGAVGRSLTGYVSGSNVFTFLSDVSNGATTVSQTTMDQSTMTLYSWDGALLTTAVWVRGEWAASHPFTVGSTVYIVTGHDDFDDAQRSYLVRNASTKLIVGRALYGRGGVALQQVPTGGAAIQFHTAATVSGNTVYLALQQTNFLNIVSNVPGSSGRLATLNFNETHGPLRSFVNGRQVLLPGGWGGRLSARDSSLTEVVPMISPSTPVATNGAGALPAGTYGFIAVYEQVDAAGNVYTSGPSPQVSTTLGGAGSITVTVRTLRQINNSQPAKIKIYMTAAGGATHFLRDILTNDPTVNTLTTATIASVPAAGAETLYTDEGELANDAVPPFRFAFEWRDRSWLTGTDVEGETWFSKEYIAGDGPEFSPFLKVTAYGGKGRSYGGGAISHDYAALFKENGVFAVTGPGPDDTGGGGGFTVLRLNWDGGTTNPSSIVSYANGCIFQGLDQQIYCVKPDLTVTDFGHPAQDLVAGATVVAAAHNPEERTVKIRLSTGKGIVLDYGSASEAAPDGLWYADESSAWGVAVASCIHSNLEHMLEADGDVWKEVASQFFDGTSTAILPRCTLQPLLFADMGGEVRISRVQFIGEFKSAHDFRAILTVDGGTPVNYDKTTVAAGPERFDIRPGGCGRTTELVVGVQQTGTGTGEGFWLDGLLLEVQPRARGRRVNSGQRI